MISGITTAFDINATINNRNYTTGQKVLKGVIQFTQGALDVAGSSAIAEGVADTGGLAIVPGAAGIVLWNRIVNRGADLLCNKLGL